MFIKPFLPFILFLIITTSVLAESSEFDPFVEMEAQQAKIEQPLLHEVQEDVKEDWPQSKVEWQENKEEYVLMVGMLNIDKKTVKVETKDNGLMITASQTGGLHEAMNIGSNTLERHEESTGYLNKSIRFPDDADLKWMSYRWVGDNLKIVVPKKKLKSII